MNRCARLMVLGVLLTLPYHLLAQAAPKREFRGAWIATVLNFDWPPSHLRATGVSQQQKDALVSILDQLHQAGFNAVIFQVRPECDALYNSPYEPWSYWLTGQQGVAPNPYYDPLQFAVEEAHKRGMELHAWFNPYRAVRPSIYTRAPNHVSNRHPEWILDFPNGKILDPGLPAVRDYVARVVSDIVRRYDIDGIHADDYFYPYPKESFPGITNQDDATYAQNNPEGLDRGTWRRENVNKLLKQISDSIRVIKPHVKFGMSPFGIWKNGVPSGIFGLDAYSTIYCDAITWLQRKYIDYLAPQLYWAFGGGQDYARLQPWWADSAAANGRHLYTGNATYRIGSGYAVTEIPNQINFNRANPKVQGSIQFRALSITGNLGGIHDLLKSNVFLYASIIPAMSWKADATPPNVPVALTSSTVFANSYRLQWTPPSAAADGDTAARYAIYRFTTPVPAQKDRESGRSLLSLTGIPQAVPRSVVDTVGVQFYYAVSALDRNNNESDLSNVIPLSGGVIPTQPVLAYPSNNEQFFPQGGRLKWRASPNAIVYRIEFDSTQNFGPSSMLVRPNVSDTTILPTGLLAARTYYWRVAAGNQVGTSSYSQVFSFKTGWPLPPTLVSPASGTKNLSRTPTFTFTRSTGTSWRLLITDAASQATALDTTVTDTSVTISRTLAAFKVYGWRVAAINAYGSSDWSAEYRFRTESVTFVENDGSIPTDYVLSQNYPNPFNPVTTIQFTLPQEGHTVLRVYDLLGREVAVLVNESLAAGRYTVQFNASELSSGMYIYTLTSGGMRLSKRMVLLR